MSLSLYYEGQSLEDMVTALRRNYLTTSGWMESADSKLSTRDGRPLPWFAYAAIDFLERTLTPDLAMFEYGGGQSTRYWADRLSHVHSIDHDPAFVEMVRRALPARMAGADGFLYELTYGTQRGWLDSYRTCTKRNRSMRDFCSAVRSSGSCALSLPMPATVERNWYVPDGSYGVKLGGDAG